MNQDLPSFGGVFQDAESLRKYLVDMKNSVVGLRKEEITRSNNSNKLKELSEYYYFSLYINALIYHKKLALPFSFKKTEHPDFIMGEDYGLEVVKATKADYQSWLTKFEKSNQCGSLSKNGYCGNEPELEMAMAVKSRIEKKNKKIEEYHKHHQDLRNIGLLISVEAELPLNIDALSNALIEIQQNGFDKISLIVAITPDEYVVFYKDNSLPSFEILKTPNL